MKFLDNEQIGKMIRFHRKKSGLTQKELGKLADLGKTVVYDLEKGKLTVKLNTLVKILNVLNIRIHFESPLMYNFENDHEKANVYVDGKWAGELQEIERGQLYRFVYQKQYDGPSVSLTMPTTQSTYEYDRFPPFFEGVLPEGVMLDGLLRQLKLDRNDLMGQLIAVGHDLVGNVTVEACV